MTIPGTRQVRTAIPVVLSAIVLLFAVAATGDRPDANEASHRIMNLYVDRIDSLGLSLEQLERAIDKPDTTQHGATTLRAAYLYARQRYKQIEFLVESTDREAASKLNGDPVPEVDTSNGTRTVVPPEGYQVIEEMIFANDLFAHRQELRHQISAMRATERALRASARELTIDDRQMLEAMRQQVVRIMTLGIVGFDTPGSGKAITEAAWSLSGVRDALTEYLPALQQRDAGLTRSLVPMLDGALSYLRRHPDFESFDRLSFIRAYGNPLYAELLHVYRALGIGIQTEGMPLNQAVNYEAENIFSPDFLNPYFHAPDQQGSHNEHRAELGRMLFFDPVLSGNNLRSCASCHRPELAFTDGAPHSIAFNEHGTVTRNAPTLLNSAFQSGQFHDMRARFFENQIEQVLLNENEMHTSFESLITKLTNSPDYVNAFGRAFAGTLDTGINSANIRSAIATYLRTLVALNSPFDRYMRGESSVIEPSVKRGFNLFMGKAACGTCHFAPIFNGTVPPHFTETEAEVLGITADANFDHPVLDLDPGRYNVEHDESKRHAFKTPTLRNVALTAPYMHNGQFRSLDDVIEFYNRGGGAGLGLDVGNQTLSADRLNLSSQQKHDLISFLKALTDTTGLESQPTLLPRFPLQSELDQRVVRGRY